MTPGWYKPIPQRSHGTADLYQDYGTNLCGCGLKVLWVQKPALCTCYIVQYYTEYCIVPGYLNKLVVLYCVRNYTVPA